jgi:Ca2+-binding RTX toxin-like protein
MPLYGTNGSDRLYGTADADQIFGYDGDDTLVGFGGDDYLVGGAGSDSLYGGPDNDVLRGGDGADLLDGGTGNDTATYEYSPADVHISLAEGLRAATGGAAEGDTLVGIENLTGSAYGDELWGDSGANTLRGLGGADTLKGFGGADALYGGDNNDTLYGMDGMDTLRGQDGDDTINGGANRDNLYGGFGADTFVWSSAGDTGLTRESADMVWDFHVLDGDRIDLRAIDANVYAAGNQDFTFIGTAPFTLNAATADPTDVVPGEVRYYQSGGDTYLELQTGTSADVEAVIRVSGLHTPTAAWFML